jgi:type VI secretion system secreted protein Hcp
MDTILLDIPDIKGESTLKGFEDKIELLSFSHGVAMQITPRARSLPRATPART